MSLHIIHNVYPELAEDAVAGPGPLPYATEYAEDHRHRYRGAQHAEPKPAPPPVTPEMLRAARFVQVLGFDHETALKFAQNYGFSRVPEKRTVIPSATGRIVDLAVCVPVGGEKQ